MVENVFAQLYFFSEQFDLESSMSVISIVNSLLFLILAALKICSYFGQSLSLTPTPRTNLYRNNHIFMAD